MQKTKLEKQLNKGVTLVDFNAVWCAPCKAQAPIVEQLSHDYQGRAAVIEIDIDKNRALATKNKVQSIPTLIILKNGREMKRFVGLQSQATLTAALDSVLQQS